MIVERGRVVLQWNKSESSFLMSLTSHFMVSVSWIRLECHQQVGLGGCFASDASAVWKLCWRCGMVVRVRGFLRVVLSGWVELSFDDDVEGIKSGQSLGDSSRNQRKDRSQRIIIVPWSYA